MMKKLTLVLVCAALLCGAAAALAPQKGTLPFYWVTGTVKDPSPQHLAVPDAGVFLYKDAADLEKKQFLVTKTDKDGNYRLNAYELYYFYGKEFPYQVAVPQMGGFGAEASISPVKAAGFIQQDLILAGGQGPIFKTGNISIVVTDANGSFLSGASVIIDGSDLSGAYQGKGEYLVQDVPIGHQLIIVSSPGYLPVALLIMVEEGKTISAGKVALTALPEGSAVLWGYVKDLYGSQLGGVKIAAGSYSISSFNSGWYQLVLPAGNYSVTASLTGYADNTLNNLALNSGDTIHHDFTLSLLDPGSAGTISGTVKDKDGGQPIPGALIGDGTRNTATGPDGTFLIDGVPAGDYQVYLAAKGYVPEKKSAKVNAKATTVVDFFLTKLDPGKAALAGIVQDQDGKKLEGAEIKILNPLQTTLTDAFGGYGFINITPGALVVEASLSDYSTKKTEISLAAGDTAILDFVLVKIPAPPGTVPLTISRDGLNIKVTWEADYIQPQIFVRTGAFTNNLIDWLPVAKDGQLIADPNIYSYSEGTLIHKNQFGKGDNEVYYRAIKKTETNDKLPTAWAVGKINLTLTASPNLISSPFKMGAMLIDEVFGDQIQKDGMLFAGYDNVSKSYNIYVYNGAYPNGTWKLDTGKDFVIQPGKAYWLVNSKTGTITVIGNVPTKPYTESFSQGPNLFAFPFPSSCNYSKLDGAGLGPQIGNMLARYNNSTKSYEMMEVKADKWLNTEVGKSDFGLNPGLGYWYMNSQTKPVDFKPEL